MHTRFGISCPLIGVLSVFMYIVGRIFRCITLRDLVTDLICFVASKTRLVDALSDLCTKFA